MKHFREFVVATLVGGLLVITPIYLSGLLLLKAMRAAAGLVAPLAKVLPEWFPAENVLSLLLVLFVCFLVGLTIRTQIGKAVQAQCENWLLQKVPGYGIFRSLTQRLAGTDQENTWRPVLAEIEEALVPAFIIEELDDGRFTVFVPSVPTPLSGAVYVLVPERVHLLSASFTQAFRTMTRWGTGTKDLVATMRTESKEHAHTRPGASPDRRSWG